LLPRRVVRVLRCVFRDERRSEFFAASSLDEPTCDEVMSHCSISVFSLLLYCVIGETCLLLIFPTGVQSIYYLCFGKHGRREFDHIGLGLDSSGVGLLDQRPAFVVESRHVADVS